MYIPHNENQMSCVVVLLPVSCPTIAILASFEDQVYHLLRRRQGKLGCSVHCPKKKLQKTPSCQSARSKSLLCAYSLNILLPKKCSQIKPWPPEDEKYDKKVSTQRFCRSTLCSRLSSQAPTVKITGRDQAKFLTNICSATIISKKIREAFLHQLKYLPYIYLNKEYLHYHKIYVSFGQRQHCLVVKVKLKPTTWCLPPLL